MGECSGHPNERKYSETTLVPLLLLFSFFLALASNNLEVEFDDFNLLFIFLFTT